jgi:hypothetical protein
MQYIINVGVYLVKVDKMLFRIRSDRFVVFGSRIAPAKPHLSCSSGGRGLLNWHTLFTAAIFHRSSDIGTKQPL